MSVFYLSKHFAFKEYSILNQVKSLLPALSRNYLTMAKKNDTVKKRPRTRSQCDAPEFEEVAAAKELKNSINGEAAKVKTKEEEEGDFSNFAISKKTIKKLKDNGVASLFPVQSKTFKEIQDGLDLIVQARTGTGKTLAFALPVLEMIRQQEEEICTVSQRPPMVLTLAPTRELAIQIHKEFEKYKSKKMNISCFYGGSSYEKQENEIWRGIDVLVGTPGRLLDLIQKGTLDVAKLKHVVLDEADRMMDMGFQDILDEILAFAYTKENKPQTLLFSATLPPWVKKTSQKYMSKNMKAIDLVGTSINKGSILVEHKAIKCSYWERASTIKDIIQVYSGKHGKTIIFTSTKKEANELALNSVINMDSQVLHGDIQQKQREITLTGFRSGKFNCLIATDVASRGIDIPEVDLVIQTEPPKDVESYIHRAGRTGRAGRMGVCIIFYKAGQEFQVQCVEKKAGISFIRIGAPQQGDIIKTSAKDALKALDQVKDNVLEFFLPTAQKLIEERGAEKALASALAFISGVTEIVNRSMLTSQAGYTTYLMKQNWELRSTGLIWSILRRHFETDFTDNIRGMKMTKDKLGCVFDVPTDSVKIIEDTWKGDKFATLDLVTELPELVEGVSNTYQNNNNSFGNRNNSYGNNSYGNNNNYGNRNNNSNNNYGNQGNTNSNRGFGNRGFGDKKRQFNQGNDGGNDNFNKRQRTH